MSKVATTTVRLTAGVYVTATCMGHKGSSTQSAEMAVKALGTKIGIAHLLVIRSGQVVKSAAGNDMEIWELWGKQKSPGQQAGLALETLLLIIAGGIALLLVFGVVMVGLLLVALMALGEMD